MYELKVTVKKVMGECTASPPMKPGDYFTVNDGDIQVPEGGYICAWALQSMMPVFPILNVRDRLEDGHWVKTVKNFVCPDPKGLVHYRLEVED